MGIVSVILDLLFPPRCTFCRKILSSGESAVCETCKTELPHTTGGGRKYGDSFSYCISPLYYEGKVRDSILRFKFRETTSYSKVYGKMIADCIREYASGCYDLISWVPLSEQRLKKRGYDQAMLLAMSAALELSDVAVETLKKQSDIPAQSGLSDGNARRENVSGVYIVPDVELVADKRILLVDDIVTTGSTLSECARMLREAGASDVICAALARTRE